MAKYSEQLDAVLTALADPTRRTVVDRLGRGPASVGELAEPLAISLPSFMKHVRTLENCGLIRTKKTGRVRTCVLNRDRLRLLDSWLADQRRMWEESTDRLEHFVIDGTDYTAVVRHGSPEQRARHEELGFFDGWGTVTDQLAAAVE
ncbi:ArsR/SmtB family transcription factor [Brevibacterium oceani]|uniref:ArsR/SmtB family transcription factor n=1 Tax=Brevibacterium oceani TaxID=358099 RepID=UPI001B33E0D9|nr:metalloregulator ArsR/SmtB family transcription factor [Brevibacterium oceani]